MTKIKYKDKKLGRPVKGVTYKNNPERVIVSKFKGRCYVCQEDISVGDWVSWSPGIGARHKDC